MKKPLLEYGDIVIELPRVRVDLDSIKVEGVIVSEKVSSTGLVKVQLDMICPPTVVRHVARVEALNDAARKFLRR